MKIAKKFAQLLGDNMERIKEKLGKEIDSIRRFINDLEELERQNNEFADPSDELNEAYDLLYAYKLVYFDMFGEDY